MMKFLALMPMIFAAFLVAACQTAAITEPCDVLVPINPAPATNSYLVANDRVTAMAIAQHRGRYQKYRCGK
ncbi:hypothetical protein [uncultured Nitratireductor sp.]|uniref:hypothetical protein n=1 Tax=uncultured Nitratireductor sp. TaxID=520953 RepID=UPI0026022027|nr:hypothetical protein [uncultured Nitratireductor sp.]